MKWDRASGKRNVLIVEDNAEIVSFIRGLLSDRYSLFVAETGQDALHLLFSEGLEAGVVLLDHRLPDMTGLEVLHELKRIKPHIPVIFITGYGSEDLAVKAFKGGAKDYLKKPFNYRQLLQAVEFCLSLHGRSDRGPRTVLTQEFVPATGAVDGVNESVTKYSLQKALIFINDNYMNRLNLAEVAEKACTSKHHFSREFRKYIGCTFREYLKKVRTEKVRELLRKTNLSITEAGVSVGFTDLRNFERIFKNIHGCTPRQYKDSAPELQDGREPQTE